MNTRVTVRNDIVESDAPIVVLPSATELELSADASLRTWLHAEAGFVSSKLRWLNRKNPDEAWVPAHVGTPNFPTRVAAGSRKAIKSSASGAPGTLSGPVGAPHWSNAGKWTCAWIGDMGTGAVTQAVVGARKAGGAQIQVRPANRGLRVYSAATARLTTADNVLPAAGFYFAMICWNGPSGANGRLRALIANVQVGVDVTTGIDAFADTDLTVFGQYEPSTNLDLFPGVGMQLQDLWWFTDDLSDAAAAATRAKLVAYVGEKNPGLV